MSYSNNRKRNAGFTLIELLLVMVILVVLASIVALNFGSVNAKKNETKAKTDISNLETALEMYKTDVGDYPSGQDGLSALVSSPGNATHWNGPYVKRGLPVDPWGHNYLYVYPGNHNGNGFDLSSAGDGKANTADLDNWTAPTAK